MRFEFYMAPEILFGAGSFERLKDRVPRLGDRALLILGGLFADEVGLTERLRGMFPVGAIVSCEREPTVEDVDRAVAEGKRARCDMAVAVGGGSALDCGKAAAAMMTNSGSLSDYLEGVGTGRILEKDPIPLVAVPTTAGTGSEATKNAVISGPSFKKSIRSPLLIPRVAIVDPLLHLTMPASVTASSGLDALTQLIESYLSVNAFPLTDALALEGIRAAGPAMDRVYSHPQDTAARENMALAALLGGICLTNAGLGAVHGIASPLGALFHIPHGVACAALLPQVMQANLFASQDTPKEDRVWSRFARVAEALTERRFVDRTSCVDAGLTVLQQFQHRLKIPRLSRFGVTVEDIPKIVHGSRGSSMRFNPVELGDEQIEGILKAAL